MGERLHQILTDEHGTKTRIYAPVGRHADLLAYLVRRLLENGANGSFVNMIADRDVPASRVAADPFETALSPGRITVPADIFAPSRRNSRGADITDPLTMATPSMPTAAGFAERDALDRRLPARCRTGEAGEHFRHRQPRHRRTGRRGHRRRSGETIEAGHRHRPRCGARTGPHGRCAERALLLRAGRRPLRGECRRTLRAVRSRSRQDAGRCGRRSARGRRFPALLRRRGRAADAAAPLGVVTCISPWNFPLAIFTGQVAAALVTGNAVLAKPAEATPLIAARAVG